MPNCWASMVVFISGFMADNESAFEISNELASR